MSIDPPATIAAGAGDGSSSVARRRLFTIFGGFVALGLAGATFGAAWPEMRLSFGQQVSSLAWIGICTTILYATGGAISGALMRTIGVARVFVVAGTVGAVGMAVVALAGRWLVVPAAATLIGFGNGLLDATGNTYVAARHGVRAMGILHASFGAGAVLSPLILGIALRAGVSWRMVFVVTATLFAALAVVVATQPRGWELTRIVDGGDASTADLAPAANPCVALGIVMFAVYVAFEITLPQWASSVITDARHAAASTASLWVAAFWAAFTAIRLAMGWLVHRVGEGRLLDASMGVALTGACVFWLVPTATGAGIGMILAGAGQSAFFPMHVALTVRRVGTARAGTVIGRQVTAASAGFFIASGAVGWLVRHAGLTSLGPAVVVLGIATAILDQIVRRRALGHRQPRPQPQPA